MIKFNEYSRCDGIVQAGSHAHHILLCTASSRRWLQQIVDDIDEDRAATEQSDKRLVEPDTEEDRSQLDSRESLPLQSLEERGNDQQEDPDVIDPDYELSESEVTFFKPICKW